MSIAFGVGAKGSGTGTSVTTNSVTTTNGSTFIIGVIGDPATYTTPTDSKSNTYLPLADYLGTNSNGAIGARWWYCEQGTGGTSHTFTGNASASQTFTVVAIELVPAGGYKAVLHTNPAGLEDDSTPYASNSTTTTVAAAMLVSMLAGNSSSNPATHAESTGFTIPAAADETDGSSKYTGCLAYRSVTSTGTYNSSFTETGSGSPTANISVWIASFIEEATAASITPPTGSLTITGYAPTRVRTGVTEFDVPSGDLRIVGRQPTVRNTTKQQPLIEVADATVSGTNTATGSAWAVAHPAISAGDLGIVYIAWDDSTNVTSVVPPTGPGGGTFTAYSTAPITDSATETRAKLWWYKADSAASASTVVFNSVGVESWSATWIRVPAGEFDPANPIGSTLGIGSASTSAVTSPSMNAGVSDGGGTLLWFVGVDTDPMSASVATAGWTTLQTQDLGAVAHAVARRDAPVVNSEAFSAGAYVWNMQGTNQDTWTGILAVVRAPDPQTAFPDYAQLAFNSDAPSITVSSTSSPNITTGVGALTLTGYAPTVVSPVLTAPSAGALTFTGVAPTVTQATTTTTVNTATGALVFTGYEPTQTYETDPPVTGQLVFTGVAPTVTTGASVTRNPTTGALVFTGAAPTIQAPVAIATASGALVVTGVAPTVNATENQAVATAAGSLTFAGQAPSIQTPVAVTTASGSLALTGVAPTVQGALTASPTVGQLVLTGVAPVAQVSAAGNVNAATGELVLTGQAPTVQTPVTVNAAAGALVVTGQAPTIQTPVSIAAAAGALTITGQAPTILTTAHVAIEVATGGLVLAGYAPVLSEGGSFARVPDSAQIVFTGHAPEVLGGESESRQTGGGTKKRRYRKPYVVEIDGEDFVVSSAEQAEELLAKAQEAAEELLVDVRVSPKPVATPKAPRIRVKGPAGPDLTELVSMVSDTREAIRELYLVARNAEIGVLMRKIEEDDEDDALVALLLH